MSWLSLIVAALAALGTGYAFHSADGSEPEPACRYASSVDHLGNLLAVTTDCPYRALAPGVAAD